MPDCMFPARQLLEEMRRVCKEADATHDPQKIHNAAEYVRTTTDLRFAHETLTGCHCWYEAAKK